MRAPPAAIASVLTAGTLDDVVLEELEQVNVEFFAASRVSCNRDSILSNLISERMKYDSDSGLQVHSQIEQSASHTDW